MGKRIVTNRRYSINSPIVKDTVGYNYVTTINNVLACYFHCSILFAQYIIKYTIAQEIVRMSVNSEQNKNRHNEVAV